MKLNSFLTAVLIIFFIGNAEAQTPEEIWQEYKLLYKSPNELLLHYSVLDEPYYSWALAELATKPTNSVFLSYIFTDMINRLPKNSDYIFREFWHRFGPVAPEYTLKWLLINPNTKELPESLNWFIDDVVNTLLRKEINNDTAWFVGCLGPKRYRNNFLERFFAGNPLTFELAAAVTNCDENKELFLTKLLNRPDLIKMNLLDVLLFIDKFPKFYDQYFSLLLLYGDELNRDDINFIENTCKTEPYCPLFSQFKFSAVLERREKLIEIMKNKKQ